ncbi:MAG: aromatic ring-hydroxylating dioxygenase subunit alpha [Gammaproteobacteria bacterium]|nr:aromatic ring-hydroxylating dioxygenase subunit alpha [Gammaproteobacteria bacterium]
MAEKSHWFPVLASSELGKKPVAKKRFGENLVFWRSKDAVVCMPDRCPHRGAALSLGKVVDNNLACPFHGLQFSQSGKCMHIPVEADPRIPEGFGVTSHAVCEADGYVWLWRGTELAPGQHSLLPRHEQLEGLRYGESTSIWPAHFTRCIENVCDFSHLPFVHKKTIGLFKREGATQVDVEEIEGGFRSYLLEKGEPKQMLEFFYPNMWMLRANGNILMTAVFVPVDDHTTEVYGRSYYRLPFPKKLVDWYTRFSQFLVFSEDWPIVASQEPWDVSDATKEKLLPSDAPVIAYRKLLRSYR